VGAVAHAIKQSASQVAPHLIHAEFKTRRNVIPSRSAPAAPRAFHSNRAHARSNYNSAVRTTTAPPAETVRNRQAVALVGHDSVNRALLLQLLDSRSPPIGALRSHRAASTRSTSPAVASIRIAARLVASRL
jgi:hypothetical protein